GGDRTEINRAWAFPALQRFAGTPVARTAKSWLALAQRGNCSQIPCALSWPDQFTPSFDQFSTIAFS
ncbi:MAG: hypothetical protein FWF31_09460, partial [Desulfobulbus sp.]|nr:hypothetical protein [Desulfobulbus sp.]